MPIRFVPEVAHVPNETNGKSLTIKIKISSTVKKMYKVLVEGGTEAFSTIIKVHKTIMFDCNVREETAAARSLILTI